MQTVDMATDRVFRIAVPAKLVGGSHAPSDGCP